MAALIAQEPAATFGGCDNEDKIDFEVLQEVYGLPKLAVEVDWPTTSNTTSSPTEQVNYKNREIKASSSEPLYSSIPNVNKPKHNQSLQIEHSPSRLEKSSPHTTNSRLLSRSQAGLNHTRSKSLNSEPESPCHKRIICDFEKDLTFQPKLNNYSLKIVSRTSRVPVIHRLLEARKGLADPYNDRLTFAPKLNPASVKMAQERAAKMPEVQARQAEQATARRAEVLSEYTFKPRVSTRSLKIAQALGTSFQSRQQLYLEKRQKAIDEAYKTPTVGKKLVKSNRRVPPLPPNRKSTDSTTKSQTERPHELPLGTEDSIKVTREQGLHSKSRVLKRLKRVDPKSPAKDDEEARLLHPGRRFSTLSDCDRVRRVKINSERIIRAKKVFLIMDGYRLVRKGLRNRGWIEQDYVKNSASTRKSPKQPNDSDDSDLEPCFDSDGDDYSDEEEYCMMSRAVRNAVPNFVWSLKRYEHIYRTLNRDSLVNHFAKASSFTTKVGLCSNLRNLVWYGDTDHNTFFPRCYKLSCDEEKLTFIDDYRLTAALCVLKLVPTQFTTCCEGEPLSLVPDEPPTSPSRPSTATSTAGDISDASRPVLSGEGLALATRAVQVFLCSKQHDDIEGSQLQLHRSLTDSEWNVLIKYFYKMVFEKAVILITDCSAISEGNSLLNQIDQHCPQHHMDGSRNVWIVKPGAMSRGRGIVCMNNLEDILALVSSTVKKETKWVVQKYIERPLLIYDTKFDVRQWFLVTDWNPLTMWIYKDCYMRFCTQTYTLDDLNESVHLCNNSIQRNYENSSSRAQDLPSDNMWDSNTFRDYLESIGEGGKWGEVIYPRMKQALVHVLQVTQDEIEHRKCSFELYGADFMISSDYRPWLIEVNSSPSMSLSTAVTAKLCREVLEDTLKVVVDRRDDRDCDTGGFELAYKQTKLDQPSYVGMQLCVQGASIPKPRDPTFIRKTTSVLSYKHSPPKQDPVKRSPTDTESSTDNNKSLRLATPPIKNCTLNYETPKSPSPVRSAKRRIFPRRINNEGSRIGEEVQNKNERIVVSTSSGTVNSVPRFTRTSPNR